MADACDVDEADTGPSCDVPDVDRDACDAPRPNPKRPKCLSLTDGELLSDHKRGHRSAKAQYDFYCGMASRESKHYYRSEFSELRKRIKEVRRKGCKGCFLRESRIKPGSKIPRNLKYLDRVWLDLMSLSAKSNFWCLGVIDEATGEVALQMCDGKTGTEIENAYFQRWTSWRGPAQSVVVTDAGKEFVDKKVVESLEKLGQQKESTGAFASDAHSKVERLFQTVRWSLDRINADAEKIPKSKSEWVRVLCTIENSCRNEILHNGFSSAQRCMGRGSSLSIACADTTVATDSSCVSEEVERLLELQRVAQEAHWYVKCNRAFHALRSEKARPELREYALGELVFFRRPLKPGSNKSAWHGPGTVAGVLPHKYRIEHGGHLLEVSKGDLKGANEFQLGEDSPVFAPGEKIEGLPEMEEKPAEREHAPEAKGGEVTQVEVQKFPPEAKEVKKLPPEVHAADRAATTKPQLPKTSQCEVEGVRSNLRKFPRGEPPQTPTQTAPPAELVTPSPQPAEPVSAPRRSGRLRGTAGEFYALLANLRDDTSQKNDTCDTKSFFCGIASPEEKGLSQLDVYGFSWDELPSSVQKESCLLYTSDAADE